MTDPDPHTHPLSSYFLSGYFSKTDDITNFPQNNFPAHLDKYEKLFDSVLQALCLTKEALKKRSEFNFDSGNPANLEGGIAILRTVEALRVAGFENISLVKPTKDTAVADITCEKNGQKVCLEVKTITKQSKGRPEFFMEDQLYEKILEHVSKARKQLDATATKLGGAVRILVCVVNWFEQSIYLGQDQYQQIVNRLEKDQDQRSLVGVDGVLFVTSTGQQFLFLNEYGKRID